MDSESFWDERDSACSAIVALREIVVEIASSFENAEVLWSRSWQASRRFSWLA